MTFEEFRDNPAVKEHLPPLLRSIDGLLTDHLIETCNGQSPDASTVAERAGASKAIAHIIKLFRSAASPAPIQKGVKMKQLNRFKSEKPTNEQP